MNDEDKARLLKENHKPVYAKSIVPSEIEKRMDREARRADTAYDKLGVDAFVQSKKPDTKGPAR